MKNSEKATHDSPVNTGSSKTKKCLNILVVGDWVVDEYLVTGIHRSKTASRTGHAHYRTLHPLTGSIQSFCAAGQVASLLKNAVGADDQPLFSVFGLGVWHENDTPMLNALLNASAAGNTYSPYSINNYCEASSDYDEVASPLFNLGSLLKNDNRIFGTTRTVRVYQNTGSKIEQLHRIDFELQLPHGKSVWFDKNNASDLDNSDELNKFLKGIGEVDAIIIKDLGKGVISEHTVKYLVKFYEPKKDNVKWFISTKSWESDWSKSWLGLLSNSRVEMYVIPQVACKLSMDSSNMSCWITRKGKPSLEALGNIETSFDKFSYSKPKIIALPNGMSVLCYDGEKGYKQIIPEADFIPVGLPMASVFFPACISRLLVDETVVTHDLIEAALKFTVKWMTNETIRIKDPELWPNNCGENIKIGLPEPGNSSYRVEDFNWQDEKSIWRDSRSDFGIIQMPNSSKGKIELSRSMLEVDKYVACVSSKRQILRTLMNEIRSFMMSSKTQHRSYMLVANPGSGKTFLMKNLADEMKLRLLSFNITQMISRADILDCFDTIVTTQAQNREEPIIVFIDEINAPLESQQVYEAFLAPLEEGIYVRASKTFHIDPCIWIFASTTHPIPKKRGFADDPKRKEDKVSDFASRLSLDPFVLSIENPSDNDKLPYDDESIKQVRLEKVYLGITLLKRYFPDVREVSNKVLEAFSLLEKYEIREISHFVKSFDGIIYGRVRVHNIPLQWLEDRKLINREKWERIRPETEEMIDIES